MELTELTAISPIDGRYHSKTTSLQAIFSEYGLITRRVFIEIRWLQFLIQLPELRDSVSLSEEAIQALTALSDNFTLSDAVYIKKIEKKCNHDVKAVEYFIKEKMKDLPSLTLLTEFTHFACTSEDINNLAYALMLKETHHDIVFPKLDQVFESIKRLGKEHAKVSMLSRTHGQPASPTTLGKELINFAARLKTQLSRGITIPIIGKMNGAVGNYNAHCIAYPNLDWPHYTKEFVESLGLHFNPYTTQIEPHDFIAELSHSMIRINNILMDYAKDIWGYISLGYFKQKANPESVGSSTMPHKINPIHFENAEGNLSLANTLFSYFADKLTQSRWQRDLSDSTVLRNLGVAYAHSLIAYEALLKGNETLVVNKIPIKRDLNANWDVLSEAIQTLMRRYGIENPYEQLKQLTQGQGIDAESLKGFITHLPLPDQEKARLLALTPQSYTGLAVKLTEEF